MQVTGFKTECRERSELTLGFSLADENDAIPRGWIRVIEYGIDAHGEERVECMDYKCDVDDDDRMRSFVSISQVYYGRPLDVTLSDLGEGVRLPR